MKVMDLQERFNQLRDSLSVKVVYGDPVEREGVTIVPAALVAGGGGGGGGTGEGGSGEGIGYGLFARPVGAYVLKDGDVKWVPAIDPWLVFMAIAAALLTIRHLARRHRSSR